MDVYIHNIKTFACLVSSPETHIAHKTMRVPCFRRGQALGAEHKPPHVKCFTLGGLLNVYLVAADSTIFRKVSRHFLFVCHLHGYCFTYEIIGYWLIWLFVWQCYIAKYP